MDRKQCIVYSFVTIIILIDSLTFKTEQCVFVVHTYRDWRYITWCDFLLHKSSILTLHAISHRILEHLDVKNKIFETRSFHSIHFDLLAQIEKNFIKIGLFSSLFKIQNKRFP